jgi:putative transposase
VEGEVRWAGGLGGRRLKALEEENRRLEKLLAEAKQDNAALKDILGKNG